MWKTVADNKINQLRQRGEHLLQKRPKNVILFIGDGMSLSSVTAARYLKAHNQSKSVGDVLLGWEEWPSAGLVRTFCADRMTTDSGTAATALLGGSKSQFDTIGVNEKVQCCKCIKIPEEDMIKSILLHAQDNGLSTGLVTSTRITHATPAAAYAATRSRNWEGKVPKNLSGSGECEDIAGQLVRRGLNFNVILGGGSAHFYQAPGPGTPHSEGSRDDGQNLIQKWIKAQEERNRKFAVALNFSEFRRVDTSATDYLLGLLTPFHMEYDISRLDQPSLQEMTETAIKILSKNPKGYLLMVEGGRIDHGHHDNTANLALTETLALEKAVNAAQMQTNSKDTLLAVTADHSHPFSLQGYATREKSVLDINDYSNASDSMPFLIAAYANGPGAQVNKSRSNPGAEDRFGSVYRQQALIPLDRSTHSPEDVPIYATGPFSDLFCGTMDNTYVAYATMYSLCIGPYQNEAHCAKGNNAKSNGNLVYGPMLITLFSLFIIEWIS
ncbi:unnamed protein product [Calicophoron daubneyi]|uniref:alkaline phosphatase n=1 Tax=Calicophoron daubneyi TaxID=300641 RepID=A0AAV2TPX8_CALDB